MVRLLRNGRWKLANLGTDVRKAHPSRARSTGRIGSEGKTVRAETAFICSEVYIHPTELDKRGFLHLTRKAARKGNSAQQTLDRRCQRVWPHSVIFSSLRMRVNLCGTTWKLYPDGRRVREGGEL